MNAAIKWNHYVKLILSDVDETVADLYVRAAPEMITELVKILKSGISIFFITGQGLENVQRRIVDYIPSDLRSKVLVAHCSGAEVWGFQKTGELRKTPFYSVYEKGLTHQQKIAWRQIIDKLLNEFHLTKYPVMPIPEFKRQADANPFAIMFEDRGPQITFEFVNSYDLNPGQLSQVKKELPHISDIYDLRIPVLERAEKLFFMSKIPVTPRFGGMFALDFIANGVSKATAVKKILEDPVILKSIGLHKKHLMDPKHIEIWGDKFSLTNGGTDRYMCEAVDPSVRAIDFREENPAEFVPEYNIVLWNRKNHLHEGLLEYLHSKHD